MGHFVRVRTSLRSTFSFFVAVLSCVMVVHLVGACGGSGGMEEVPPPEVANPIQDTEMLVTEDPKTFDLDEVFSVPEDSPINYSATSSDGTVVSASISNVVMLTLDPKNGGVTEVTVTAETDGGSAETSFEVTVELPPPPNEP